MNNEREGVKNGRAFDVVVLFTVDENMKADVTKPGSLNAKNLSAVTEIYFVNLDFFRQRTKLVTGSRGRPESANRQKLTCRNSPGLGAITQMIIFFIF